MTETKKNEGVARAVELIVYAPIGFGLYLRDLAPSVVRMFIARGRAEVERRSDDVQRHVTSARSFGEATLAFGMPGLLRRDEAASAAPEPPKPAQQAAPARPAPPTPVPTPAPAPSGPPSLVSVPDTDARDLPIPGYDALSASQVVERLAGLGRSELDAVHAYEATHRQRRTILGKIEQLAG
jgi:hypothetical protein